MIFNVYTLLYLYRIHHNIFFSIISFIRNFPRRIKIFNTLFTDSNPNNISIIFANTSISRFAHTHVHIRNGPREYEEFIFFRNKLFLLYAVLLYFRFLLGTRFNISKDPSFEPRQQWKLYNVQKYETEGTDRANKWRKREMYTDK